MPENNLIALRHHQAHSGFYLTLMSIMQGMALAYLLQVIASEITTYGGISLLTCFQSIAILAIIIIVWHEYAIGTIIFRWKLNILDSTIPFLFGIVEYIMIAAVWIPLDGHPMSAVRFTLWLWILPAFCVVSCVAYWNQISKAIIDSDTEHLLPVTRRNRIQAFGTAVLFAVLATANALFHFTHSAQCIVAGCIALVFIGHAIRINKAYDDAQPIQD